MRHPWFEHLMNHPAQTEPYNPLPPFVRNDAFYWRNFHFPLFYDLQEGNSLALEVLEHLAAKGDILSMERVSLYYFDKCQFSKAFLLFKALHEKMQTTEWYDWEHLAAKGDILSMERVSLYYFDKCQFSKAFLLFKALHEKMQTTEWYDWAIKQEISCG